MTTTLVLTADIGKHLRELASLEVESGAVLLVRPVEAPNGAVRLLARQLREVPEAAYARREARTLEVTSDGYVPALQLAENAGCVPMWLHTHPGSGSAPSPSARDKRVDEQLSDLFRLRANSAYYGSLIVALDAGRLSFTGHLDDGTTMKVIDRMLEVGSRLSLQLNFHTNLMPLPALFDRNIRAYGGAVQRTLGELYIAVVGCGGTGSAVAEQLVRLGVRHLRLVDPDTLSASNVTRVYGSTAGDIGRPKVALLRDHLLRIAPEAIIQTEQGMITSEWVAHSLTSADLIFGCTDDNAGRLVLSRIATYFLIPVIDCGVILTSGNTGQLEGIHGRVTVLHPGSACLVCRNRVDTARAASEMMTPGERKRLVDEGYAPALREIEPAVVAFTTMVAASAVGELLERLTAFGPTPAPSEIILRIHDREVSTNFQSPRPTHYCHPEAGKLGLGETVPFLEQTWSA